MAVIGLLVLAPTRAAVDHPDTYDVQVDLKNISGQVKTDWPVILKVYTVLGRNLSAGSINPAGFHVFDPAGKEVAFTLETIPPYDVPGNDEIIFVVPRMESGQILSYRIVNNNQPGSLVRSIDVVAGPHNLIANGRVEKTTAEGTAEGFTGGSQDAMVKHSGPGSLKLTAEGGSTTAKLTRTIKLNKGSWYYFGAWSKTNNVARFGYDTGNGGGHFKFEYTNPDTTAPADKPFGSVMSQCYTRDWLKCTFEGGRDAWGMDRYAAQATAAEATIEFVLNQPNHYYFEPGKGRGTWWLDDMVLIEQPEVTVRFDLALEKQMKDGLFLFTRQPEMPLGKLQETEISNIYKRLPGDQYQTIWVQMPYAHEKLTRLDKSVLKGQRVSFCVGIYHTRPIKNVLVQPAGLALEGPGGKIPLETVEYCPGYLGASPSRYMQVVGLPDKVQPVNPPGDKGVRYFFVTFLAPRDARSGEYAGNINIKIDGKAVGSVPVSLRIQDMAQPVITDTYVGLIYNGGLPDVMDMLKQYSRSGFTQIMWFHGWIPYAMGTDGKMHIDVPTLDVKMKYMKELGLIGCGLYSDIQLDDKPKGSQGRMIRMARDEAKAANPGLTGKELDDMAKPFYARFIKELDEAAKAHPDWPVFIHMNWDEPPPINEKMGWTNEILPKAITTLDVQFGRLPSVMKYYNTPAFDDPADWTGPEVYGWVKKQGANFGLCGATDTGEADRYQAGAFMIATGCKYFHAWHIRGGHTPGQMDYDTVANRTTRGPEMICWADGMDDLKTYRLLYDAIDEAKKSGKNAQAVKMAEEYLKKIGAIFNGDHRKTWSLQPFLGNAWMWGYEQFYDDWQEQMCKHAAAVKGKQWVE